MRFYLLALSLSFYYLSIAQKAKDIPLTLLQSKYHSLDSSSSASNHYQKLVVEYDLDNSRGIMLKLNYRYRIKVYKDDGEKYAAFDIQLYHEGGNKERIQNIKGITVNLENGKKVVTKLEKNQIFKEETSENRTTVRFAMPKVKAGSVIDVSYQIISPYLYTIPKWYFQHDIPTDESHLSLIVPEYFSLTPIPSGSVPLESNRKQTMYAGVPGSINDISALSVPPYIEDDYVLNDNDYRSGMKYELYAINIPGRFSKNYSTDWNSIAKNLSEAEYFGKQLKRKHKDLDEYVRGLEDLSIQEKIKNIYTYVQSNMAWNKKYGIGSYDGLKNAYKNKSGNVGDVNLMLLYMLRQAKIQAYPYVMKTRFSGLMNTHYPSLSELNYVLVAIQKEDGYMLIDATSELIPMGQLPVRAINLNGFVVKGNIMEAYAPANPNIYKIQTVSKYNFDFENAIVHGSSKRKRSNYAAFKYRWNHKNSNTNEDEQNSKIENQETDIESFDVANTYTVTDLKGFEQIDNSIQLVYDEKLVNCIKTVGDMHFVNATFDFGLDRNPFEEENREYPVFYNTAIDNKTICSLAIPEGYTASDYPEPIKIALPNGKGTFTYEIKHIGNKFIIYYILKIKDTIILPHEYDGLKEFYNIIYKLTKEKIVFTKV